jgi:two-component sensor histidine kinase
VDFALWSRPHSKEANESVEKERLQLALAAAGLGQFEWDLVRDVLVVSSALAELAGMPEGEASAFDGRVWDAYVEGADKGFLTRARDQALADGGAFKSTIRHIRPDDRRVIWLHVAGALRRDGAERAVSLVGVVYDVTAWKAEEDQRQRLFAELDHRVKNVLAGVQALAYQTAKRTTSLDAFLTNFTGRLKALGSANELLTAARWRGAAVDHILAAELGALAPRQTSWEGPELFLTPRATNALSLALHELATNAVKFGALSVETGHVEVRWRRLADGGFELMWEESGGPTVATPSRRGFGSTLLDQVTGRELNGDAGVEYRPSGLRAQLTAGAAATAPRPDSVPEVTAPRPAETVAVESSPRGLKGQRVLIVEDAVLLALELETGLSEAGAEIVGPAYELEEALALLDNPIDAAVLDANLNGRSVTPVAEALAARKVPFVFATGYGETGGAPGGFDAPVIRKPYDVTQVAAAVADLLEV